VTYEVYWFLDLLPTGVAYSERGGCFQRRLFVGLFVNMITYERLNVGWWNLVARCIVQKSHRSSNLGVIGPTPGLHTPKCGVLLSRKSIQTDVGVAHCS